MIEDNGINLNEQHLKQHRDLLFIETVKTLRDYLMRFKSEA